MGKEDGKGIIGSREPVLLSQVSSQGPALPKPSSPDGCQLLFFLQHAPQDTAGQNVM